MLKKLTFFFLIFSLPFQLGKHFWPEWSFVAGYRIDYLSPTIYLTDIIIILYLFFNRQQLLLKIKSTNKLYFYVLTTFFLINLYFAHSPTVCLVSWIRLALYIFLFLNLQVEQNLSKKIILPFSISLFFIISLEIFHLINQSSIGGTFYFIGERDLNLATPNVAKSNLPVLGQILRPYSTFSHPNSLAGFLLVSLLIVRRLKINRLLLPVIIAVILTLSKAAILSLIAILILLIFNNKSSKYQSKIKTYLLLLIPAISLLISTSYFSSPLFNFKSSILSRLYLGQLSLNLISSNIIFGVGLGNYIPAIINYFPPSQIFVYSLQPVHNIPLLFLSEFGVLGLILFSLLIKKTRLLSILTLEFLIIFIITASLDHYWWTLHQNKLILILFLAITINQKINKQKNKFNLCKTNNTIH